MLLSILALIPIGSQLIKVSSQSTKQSLNLFAQADNVARAGLIDAISWFKRQDVQPVRSSSDPITYPYADAVFFPRESTDTLTSDTLDESIGLVKEYALGESTLLWARYEVRRQQDPSLNPIDSSAVHDVTESRVSGYSAGEGLAWYIECTGYVYRRKDANVSFDQTPNEIVARSRASTEIRRLALTLPANAAATVNSRSQTTANANGKITGNNDYGLAYYSGSSGPTVSGSGAEISGAVGGSPSRVLVAGSLSPSTIFGVTESELKLMADIAVTSISGLPSEYPSMAVVYISSNATFNNTTRLRGGGILYVNGNFTVSPTTTTALFSGLIYVTGNTVITGDSLIAGALVCQGSLTLTGSGGVSQIEYDNTILNSVRQQVAQYRENKAAFYSFQFSN